MTTEDINRKLTAILSADVVGYSRLMAEDEVRTVQRLKSYKELIGLRVREHHGRVVDSHGDNILAEFPSALDAVRSAVEIQRVLKTRNDDLPDDHKMQFRIGIHLGDVMVDEDRIYGDGVNIAARLEGLADPGGICISDLIHELIRNKLDFVFEDIGNRTIKNIPDPVSAYRILFESKNTLSSPQKTEISVLAGKPSIAVLPFDNMSGDPEQEYFSDGVTEDIITRLSMNSDLSVIARQSTFYYKGVKIKIPEIGKDLGARYVVEGSVRRDRSRIRITAQLINAKTNTHVWAKTYDRELKDIFALQYEIASEIASVLNVMYKEAEIARVKRIPTVNLSAYDFFLMGWDYFNKTTKESNDQARGYILKAVELDPDYADAYALAGVTYWVDYFYLWETDPDNLEKAYHYANKAVNMDNTCWLAYMCLGDVYSSRKQFEKAIAAFNKVIELIPSSDFCYMSKGWLLSMIEGRYAEAIQMMKEAIRLNPHPPAFYQNNLGWVYRLSEKYEEAINAQETALFISPIYHLPYKELAIIYSELGLKEDALKAAAELLKLEPKFSVETYGQRTLYKDPLLAERDMTALRKAGLK